MVMVIITGANGFIGSALVWELNRAGIDDIVAVDTVSLGERPELLRDCRYRLFLSKDQIWEFLQRPEAARDVESIIHMGACSTTTELNVEFLNENNVEYTRRLWKWCTEHGKKLIYASSAAVYGDGANGFDDSSPTKVFRPLNPYGESKAAFDRWVDDQLQSGSPTPPHWLGLRFFNVFGPNENHKEFMRSVANKAFSEVRAKGSLNLFRSHNPQYADGHQKRDFVYVKDITRWTLEILGRPQIKNGIYNMGFGQARTWLDLASAIFKAMDREMKINWIEIPQEMQARYQYFTEAKIDRLLAQGLSRPEWPLERAVDDYIVQYLARGKGLS